MNRLCLFILIITFSKLSTAQPSDLAELGVGAVGLVVSDLQESEDFYNGILGMIPAGSFELDSSWSEQAGMSNNRPFGVSMFKMNTEPTSTILKLVYFEGMEQVMKDSGIDNRPGLNYLTLYFKELDLLVERIQKAGIPIEGAVVTESYELIVIRDPDGVFVELVKLK